MRRKHLLAESQMSIQYFTSDTKIAPRQLSKEQWLWNNVLYSWGAIWMSRRFQNQSYPYVGKSTRRLGFAYCIKCRVLAYLYLFCSYTERKIVSAYLDCAQFWAWFFGVLQFWGCRVLGFLWGVTDRAFLRISSPAADRGISPDICTQLLLFCQILDGPSTATKPEQKSQKLNANSFQDRLALLQGLALLEIASSCIRIEQEFLGWWFPKEKVNNNTKVVDFTMEVDDKKQTG